MRQRRGRAVRPHGGRNLDRAGPAALDLQTGATAPECRRRLGCCAGALELSLDDALEVTLLVARKDPRRHPRIAARWLLRFLEEDPDATIEEAGLVASCLAALPGAGYAEAVSTLRAVAERATRRRRERGVA